MRRVTRWAVPALVALVPLAMCMPALAQRAGGSPDNVNQAKAIVALIEQGQLNLADATKLAEQHVKGNALSATCEIKPGAAMPGADKPGADKKEHPRGPSARDGQPTGQHLIYQITCFAKDKVEVVQVDGRTRKVIEPASKRKSPA